VINGMKRNIKIVIGVVILISLAALALGYSSYFSKLFSRDNYILREPCAISDSKIIFLHHSTGKNIWDGGVEDWFINYNQENNITYCIKEQSFPKQSPYGWNNYPFDYWNIWVDNAGTEPFKDEPTLEIITEKYDVVILKHCFPVSDIEEDSGEPDITSYVKSLENYKLQYEALKEKMQQFSNTNFVVWTIPALVEKITTEEKALRAQEFYNWVKNDWDEKGDNIFLWDFYELETEGGLYFKDEYARSSENSHPNETFSKTVAPLFCQRIVDIIEGRGDSSDLTGKIG
jgi:hypothetical protein